MRKLLLSSLVLLFSLSAVPTMAYTKRAKDLEPKKTRIKKKKTYRKCVTCKKKYRGNRCKRCVSKSKCPCRPKIKKVKKAKKPCPTCKPKKTKKVKTPKKSKVKKAKQPKTPKKPKKAKTKKIKKIKKTVKKAYTPKKQVKTQKKPVAKVYGTIPNPDACPGCGQERTHCVCDRIMKEEKPVAPMSQTKKKM